MPTDTGEFARPTTEHRASAPPHPTTPHERATRASTRASSGRGLSIAGIVLGVVAVFLLPIVLGPVGIVLGYLGHRRGDPLGRTAMIVAGVGLVAGLIVGFFAFQALSG